MKGCCSTSSVTNFSNILWWEHFTYRLDWDVVHLYLTNTVSYILIVHWNTSPLIDMSLHLNTLSRPWNKQWSTMYRDVVLWTSNWIVIHYIVTIKAGVYSIQEFHLSVRTFNQLLLWNQKLELNESLRGLWNCASHHFFWMFLFLLYVLFVCFLCFFCSFPYLTLDFHIVVIRVYERVHITGQKLLWHYRVIHMQCYGIVM